MLKNIYLYFFNLLCKRSQYFCRFIAHEINASNAADYFSKYDGVHVFGAFVNAENANLSFNRPIAIIGLNFYAKQSKITFNSKFKTFIFAESYSLVDLTNANIANGVNLCKSTTNKHL